MDYRALRVNSGTRPHTSALQYAPAGTLGAVLDHDAHRGEFVTDRIGAGKISCASGGTTLLQQIIDALCIDVALAAFEPRFRLLLQQAKQRATAEQGGLGFAAGALAGLISKL